MENLHIGALCDLPLGNPGTVVAVDLTEPARSRMFDLGLMPSARVKPLFGGPFGDPRAYEIASSVIALRNMDASYIKVCHD